MQSYGGMWHPHNSDSPRIPQAWTPKPSCLCRMQYHSQAAAGMWLQKEVTELLSQRMFGLAVDFKNTEAHAGSSGGNSLRTFSVQSGVGCQQTHGTILTKLVVESAKHMPSSHCLNQCLYMIVFKMSESEKFMDFGRSTPCEMNAKRKTFPKNRLQKQSKTVQTGPD